jgi:hypothetical protein
MPKVRVELFIAYPPTSLCEKLMKMARGVVEEFGENVELQIYQRGIPYNVEPTRGFQRVRKTVKIPAILVDGDLLAERGVPSEDELRAAISKKLGEKSNYFSKR